MPGAASGWQLGHIACSGEQAACSGRWHPSSGLQAASGTLLGQGIVLASGPSRGLKCVWGSGTEFRPSSRSGSFPHHLAYITREGTFGHPCLPTLFRMHSSCHVFADAVATWLALGDSEIPLGESLHFLSILQGCWGS